MSSPGGDNEMHINKLLQLDILFCKCDDEAVDQFNMTTHVWWIVQSQSVLIHV